MLAGAALLVALLLKTFLVQAFVIPSGSMEQTIRVGDRVLVDKLTPWFGSKPERGDVVVFEDPGGWLKDEGDSTGRDPIVVRQAKEFLSFVGLLPSSTDRDLIKRVVGVGGDTVSCCDDAGRMTVNGAPIDEPYVHPGDPASPQPFHVTVPIGRIFVLGDHRSRSADSRYHLDNPDQGTVSEDQVVGRAVVIAWPIGHWRRLAERGPYHDVPDAPGAPARASGTEHSLSPESALPLEAQGSTRLPTPAELPLVMGVVGLHQTWGGRQRGVRSGCGGFGGRRSIRTWRARRRARRDWRGALRRKRQHTRER